MQLQARELSALAGSTILVTGAGGMLGRAFTEVLAEHAPDATVIARARTELDVTDRDAVLALESEQPDIIVHCAALTNADWCETQPAELWRVQHGGTQHVVELARRVSARVLYPQSVFIFDGRELPVTERTVPAPVLEYGRAKVAAERHVLDMAPDALVVRMAGFFGGDDKDKNFVGAFTRTIGNALRDGIVELEVGDRIWQPTYTVDHAANSLLLLAERCTGIYHMGSLGEAAFHEVATACVDELGADDRIRIVPTSSRPFDEAEAAKRPHRMVTANERLDAEGLNRQRHWRDGLSEYLARPWFDRYRHVARR